ncbi:11416_t:CDS:2, partial [Acaulospora colombiana]
TGLAAGRVIQTFRGRATRQQSQPPDQELRTSIEDREMTTPVEREQPDTDTRSSRDDGRSEVALKPAVAIITLFFAIFTAIMVLRSLYKNLVTLGLLGNMMLAGTIIFGGDPVVVPLLREYVVEEGWVSSRDFLIVAVYLGALAASSAGVGSWIAALLAFVGIFFSGLTLATGMDGVWKYLRRYQVVTSALRGVNAAA